jgi:hypothetical protein
MRLLVQRLTEYSKVGQRQAQEEGDNRDQSMTRELAHRLDGLFQPETREFQ